MEKQYYTDQELMEGYAAMWEHNHEIAEESFNAEAEVDRIIHENL